MGIQIALDIISVAFAITWSMFRIRYIKKNEKKLWYAILSYRAAIAVLMLQLVSLFLYAVDGSDGFWSSLLSCVFWLGLSIISNVDCISEYKKEEVDDKDGDI